ncbi:MAG: acetolactate synthase large subunit [Rhodospirillales bacterium]|nr:acetolactate synthase large subunit [Rhodospirillales bacterium]
MNGADSLVQTLLNGGVDVCFTNPGTSEMHFVAALDRHHDMRCVLGLQENVVTGAADGYARMLDKPASTLLHTGPGLANGFANLHNAKRAFQPIVNIVGDHATYHVQYDSPLTSDIEGIAAPVSGWVRTSRTSGEVAGDAAEAIQFANTAPGNISTLILPANAAWGEATAAVVPAPPPAPKVPDAAHIWAIAKIIRSGEPVLVLAANRALRVDGLELLSRATNFDGVDLLAQMSNARVERGAGRVAIDRVRYPVDQAVEQLAPYRHLILVAAKEPVAFFAYPDKPSRLMPDGCQIHTLVEREEDVMAALDGLVAELGVANSPVRLPAPVLPPLPSHGMDQDIIAAVLAHMIPDNAIISDESITTGRRFFSDTFTSRPHSWLQITGGAIGAGLPMATGAAIACPDRPVIALQADGSAMYTLQALWTQAREGSNTTTLIFSNRSYKILLGEMANVGVRNPGPKAMDMLELDRPPLDWVALAKGMGVDAGVATDAHELVRQMERGLACEGPYLIEVVL